MNDCCSTSECSTENINKRVHHCPINNKEYKKVTTETVLYQITEPWLWKDNNEQYYFCEDPDCDVFYFSETDSIINKSKLRIFNQPTGIKKPLICYCYGVDETIAMNNPNVKSFVIQKTNEGTCACESKNPSGRCCLKDFPKS